MHGFVVTNGRQYLQLFDRNQPEGGGTWTDSVRLATKWADRQSALDAARSAYASTPVIDGYWIAYI